MWIWQGFTFAIGAACALILLRLLTHGFGRDDSDAPNGGPRSELIIYTDHKTGVQYLTNAPFGFALTPRLDRDGKPIIVSPAKE